MQRYRKPNRLWQIDSVWAFTYSVIKRTDFSSVANITDNGFTTSWNYKITWWYFSSNDGSNVNADCNFNVPANNKIIRMTTRMHVYWPRYARSNASIWVLNPSWHVLRVSTWLTATSVSNNIESYNGSSYRQTIWPLLDSRYEIEILYNNWLPTAYIYSDGRASLLYSWSYYHTPWTGYITVASIAEQQASTSDSWNYRDWMEVEYTSI